MITKQSKKKKNGTVTGLPVRIGPYNFICYFQCWKNVHQKCCQRFLFYWLETCTACDDVQVTVVQMRGWSVGGWSWKTWGQGRQWVEVTWWASKDELWSQDKGKEHVLWIRRSVGKDTDLCNWMLCSEDWRHLVRNVGLSGEAAKDGGSRARSQILETLCAQLKDNQ